MTGKEWHQKLTWESWCRLPTHHMLAESGSARPRSTARAECETTIVFRAAATTATTARIAVDSANVRSEPGLDYARIGIEIHEESIAQTVFTELASIGIPLWADDSFTGPSALPFLTHVPFSVLKLYEGFLRTTKDDPQWAKTVSEMIGLAHQLSMPVIAAGVRSAAHVEMLIEHGCDMIQGGYFSQPVPVEVITALLQSGGDVAPMTGYID